MQFKKRTKILRKKLLIFFLGMFLLSPVVMLTGCSGSSSGGNNGGNNGGSNTYTVGGTVSGLNGTVVLQNNAGDDLTITSNGAFTFTTALADGAGYKVTVKAQPNRQTCTASNNTGTISGANVTNVAVACISIITVSGTVLYSPDTGPDVMLQGITVEARNPSDDSVITGTTTDTNGVYSVSIPVNHDFYLHIDGATISGTTYISENLQIENEAADRTGIKIYMVDTGTVSGMAVFLGFDATNDAVFAIDVEDSSSNGIAGVTVNASPAVTKTFYQQLDESFIGTAPTTTKNGPSVIGWVAAPGSNGTYTFTLNPSVTTPQFTIDATFKLRLIPGEISMPIEP